MLQKETLVTVGSNSGTIIEVVENCLNIQYYYVKMLFSGIILYVHETDIKLHNKGLFK